MEIKSAEEILKSHGIRNNTPFHNYKYLYENGVKAMHEYASQAVRMTLERVYAASDEWESLDEVLSLESSILSRLK